MRRFLVLSRDDEDPKVLERIRMALNFDTEDLGIEYDGIIVLGGDGTVLRTISNYKNPPVVYAVNRGKVGFLCPIPYARIDELIRKLRSGEEIGYAELKRFCLSQRKYFLNEVVIKSFSSRLNTFKIFIDDISLVIRADAIIVSTKTGSSGYNASVHGPLLLFDGMVVNAIAPNRCGFRPIVCGLGSRVRVEIDDEPLIVIDGMESQEKCLDVCYDGSSVRFGHLDCNDESERIKGLFLLR